MLIFDRCLATGNIEDVENVDNTVTAEVTEATESPVPGGNPNPKGAAAGKSALAGRKTRSATVDQERHGLAFSQAGHVSANPSQPPANCTQRKTARTRDGGSSRLGGTPRYRVSKWSRDMEEIEEVLRSLETKVDRMMEMLKDMQDNTGVTIVINNNLSIFCIEAAEGGNT
jgi:hypothetical protein